MYNCSYKESNYWGGGFKFKVILNSVKYGSYKNEVEHQEQIFYNIAVVVDSSKVETYIIFLCSN